MKLQVFEPEDALLKKFIDHFYILNNEEGSAPIRYYAFPNTHTIVSINKSAEFLYDQGELKITHNPAIPLCATIISNYMQPIEIIIPGYVEELTICFKPLGINCFLARPLSNYINEGFTHFNPYDDFRGRMSEIMQNTDPSIKVMMLERYLLSKYRSFTHPFLPEMIAEMTDESGEVLGIDELAKKYHTTRKTVCKQFEQHVGKTPSELKKIVRFRHAVKRQHYFMPNKTKLSDIAYHYNFFDQSHLIKDFRSITGMAPSAFFKSVTLDEAGRIIWLYC